MLDVIASNKIVDARKINSKALKRLNPISLELFRIREKETPQIKGKQQEDAKLYSLEFLKPFLI